MGTRLRPSLASGAVAVLAMVSIPGIVPAQAVSTDAVSATESAAAEDTAHVSMMGEGGRSDMLTAGGHGDMMGAGGHREMIRSMSSMGRGQHKAAGCLNMVGAPGHDKHMAGNGQDEMMSGGSRHGMS